MKILRCSSCIGRLSSTIESSTLSFPPSSLSAVLVMVAALIPVVGGCRRAEPPPVTNVIVARVDALPGDPSQEAWDAAPEFVAPLILQDVVDPRLMEPSTSELRVRGLTDGSRLAFRLEWPDPTCNDAETPDTFSDACAIQLPAKIDPTIPAPQMGEAGLPVHITYWNADWQAKVDGRGDSLQDLYPNATVDHYPFEAASLEPGSPEQQAMAVRYAPARALGNVYPNNGGPPQSPVQDLVAEGPGTLRSAEDGESDGSGRRIEGGWAVVLSRPLPDGLRDPKAQTQVAFAVWEGTHRETGSRKMRTGWIALSQQEKP